VLSKGLVNLRIAERELFFWCFLAVGAFLKCLLSHRRPSRRNGMQAMTATLTESWAELAFSHKPPA
jgi:hypothetical protein